MIKISLSIAGGSKGIINSEKKNSLLIFFKFIVKYFLVQKYIYINSGNYRLTNT